MDVRTLCEMVGAGTRVKFLFFWGHRAEPNGNIGKGVLSQWWEGHPFDVDGVRYLTAEHYMMAEKARLFDDAAGLDAVLGATNPGAAKKAGRGVRNFDDETWKQHRFEIVVRGSLAKFGQHTELGDYLRMTGDRVLVEASPRDAIWGIGLGASNPAAEDPRRWRGQNLLGFALMAARERLGA